MLNRALNKMLNKYTEWINITSTVVKTMKVTWEE